MRNSCKLPVKKQARRKYDAIMRASCDLFLKHGYTRTSMDAIATEADVSKQTVYSYFKTKDDLFCEMIEYECTRHNPPNEVLTNPKIKPKDALYLIARGFMDMMISPRGVSIYRLVIGEAERHPHIAKLFYDHGTLCMHVLLVNFLKVHNHKHYEIDNLDSAATNFFSLLKGRYNLRISLRLKQAPNKKDVDAHIHEIIRLFEKLYAK